MIGNSGKKDEVKRPMVFTVLGVLALIGGIFSTISAIFLMTVMVEFQGIMFLVIFLPGVLSLIQGVGMLQMRTWLPNFVVGCLIFSIALTIYASISDGDITILPSEIVGFVIGGLITAYIYSQEELFVN